MQMIDLLTQCLNRAKRWRTPPNWAPDDWQEELLAVAWAALWEALSQGIREEAPLRRFIMAALMRRYREEWNFGTRWVVLTSNEDNGEMDEDSDTDYLDKFGEWDANTVNEDTTWVALIIRRALERLSEEERYLLERKFWDMATEREIAKELGISQPAVHKRLKRALERVRTLLQPF
ncbi:MAG: hypothetical protein LKKZDAJK_000838 [Candidatus Fervidibacter sp.]